ncbi:UNVERIFIED_CONTAM: hypothetical protein K2H54_005946 [Gekko kuhli]
MSTPSRSSPPPPPLREGSVVSAAGLPKPRKPDKPPKPSKPSSTPSDRSKSKPAKGPKRPSESKSTSPTPKRPKHLGSASTPTSTPTRTPRPRSELSAPPSDDRSQPLTTPEDHQAQVVTVPSRSPSIYSRPPSEILDHEDSPADTRRDRRDWLTDVESGRRPRYSRSRSRSYRDDYLPLSRGHRYRRYSPDSRSPSPYTYARRYFASRDRPDSRLMSPYPRSREPDRRDRRSSPRREELPPRPLQPPSAALSAPPSDPAPRHVDPPLYMPDLSKPTESSADSDDHGSGASDSDPDASEVFNGCRGNCVYHWKAVNTVEQKVVVIPEEEKRAFTRYFIETMKSEDKVIIFVGKKLTADDLSSDFGLQGIPVQSLHGNREQCDREQALEDFKKGRVRILVATDLASRGLDVQDITHVFNFDFPRNIEEYVHRVGRTGRAGRTGEAVTLVTRNDWRIASELIEILERGNQVVIIFMVLGIKAVV